MEEGIISKSPVPENAKAFNAPKVDNYLGDIFKSTNRPLDLQVDESLCKAQRRLLNTMGPLGKVWTIVDNIRSGNSGSTAVDSHKMLQLIEQSIILLGQSDVLFNFHCRLAILSRVTKSQRRAKIVLKENDKYFKKNHSSLFGHAFHKTLKGLARAKKESKSLVDDLSSSMTFYSSRGGARRGPFRGLSREDWGEQKFCGS